MQKNKVGLDLLPEYGSVGYAAARIPLLEAQYHDFHNSSSDLCDFEEQAVANTHPRNSLRFRKPREFETLENKSPKSRARMPRIMDNHSSWSFCSLG